MVPGSPRYLPIAVTSVANCIPKPVVLPSLSLSLPPLPRSVLSPLSPSFVCHVDSRSCLTAPYLAHRGSQLRLPISWPSTWLARNSRSSDGGRLGILIGRARRSIAKSQISISRNEPARWRAVRGGICESFVILPAYYSTRSQSYFTLREVLGESNFTRRNLEK